MSRGGGPASAPRRRRAAAPGAPLLTLPRLWCLLSVAAARGAAGSEADDEGACPAGASSCFAEDGISEDIRKQCPAVDSAATPWALWLLRQLGGQNRLLQMLSLWPQGIDPGIWADDYVAVSYLMIVRISLGLYKSRDSSWVRIPTGMGDPGDVVRVERIAAPHWDVDGTPNFLWFEGVLPEFVMRHLYAPGLTCFHSLLRRLSTDSGLLNGTFDDTLDDPVLNRWDTVLPASPYKRKLDWTMAFYDIAKTWDREPLWPPQSMDFQPYWKEDEFDDKLEHAIAFHLIGSHRLESGSWRFDNLTGIDSLVLPFRVPLNQFSAFEVREHFGRYGADMYFNEDGLPVLLQTPDGEIILRGDRQWQYWKFVWRSTLITGITLVDHLHFTHFRISNLLARASRVTLPPKSPFRRLTSIFSFGAIFVNLQAMHTLIGPNHMLHRATPFKKFSALSDAVPAAASGLVPDIFDARGIKPLFNDTEWDSLHPRVKESPYFADGRLIARAIQKLFAGTFQAMGDTLCAKDGTPTPMFKLIKDEIISETNQAGYAFYPERYADHLPCTEVRDLVRRRFEMYVFTVTAWHKHVGFVGDYYKDPQLATMSWREGEPFGRPKQHIIMTIINVFTSTNQPHLKEDFTHLFKGMEPDLEGEFVGLWRFFQRDLQEAEEEIERRNKMREIPSDNMSPKVLEAAVSK